MNQVRIISDSTCDLPDEKMKKYGIEIVPLSVNLGGKVFLDNRVDVTGPILFDYVKKEGVLPGTIGVSVDAFHGAFARAREEGFDVVCHTISSDMSCTYQNAVIAAQDFDGIHIVDSRSLSGGVGLLVLHSAELVSRGLSAAEIAAQTRLMVPRVSATFFVDTLDYLRRGGRCSSVAALGANLFKIKPMIMVEDGQMRVGKKFRGTFAHVLDEYLETQLATHSIDLRRVMAHHTIYDPELLCLMREALKKHIKADEIIEGPAGATITSHCGPNTFGILFFEK